MSQVTVTKLHTLSGHNHPIYTINGARNSSVFYSGSGDGMVVEWDLREPENGRLIAQIPHSVYSIDLNSETGYLSVGHNYEGVQFIDTKTREQVGSVQLTTAAIYDLKSWKNLLIVATGEGEVIFFDTKSLSVVKKLKLSPESARCIDIDPVHQQSIVGFSDNSFRIINLNKLEVQQEIQAHENSIFTARYGPNRDILITGSRDAHLKFWTPDNGYNLTESIVAHMYAINHLDFSPDGKHFVTCSMDKTIKVWDLAKRKLLKIIDKARHDGHSSSVNKVLWTNFRSQLISCSDDRTISVWDLNFNNA